MHQSVVLMDHDLWEDVCLRWATTDYGFEVNMSFSGAPFRERPRITSHIMFPLDGKFEVDVNCVYNICLFELSSCTNKIAPLVLTLDDLGACAGMTRGTDFELSSASYQCESIPLLLRQRLKQSRGSCLPFRLAR